MITSVTIGAVVALAGLGAWLLDRRDHRRHLERGADKNPAGMRATGEAWRSIAGDGPPTPRGRHGRTDAQLGPASSPPHGCALRSPKHGDEPRSAATER